MTSVADKLKQRTPRTTGAKQVRLRLVYIDFWSTVKLSFLVWLSAGIVLLVATILVWVTLFSTGIFTTLDEILGDLTGDENFSVEAQFGLGTVAGFAFIVAVLNTVIGTALGAVGAVLYNATVRLTGGLLVGFQNN